VTVCSVQVCRPSKNNFSSDREHEATVVTFHAGLPDGLFSNPKFQFGKISEGLRLENVDIFYGH
jgi:hypothetical protein